MTPSALTLDYEEIFLKLPTAVIVARERIMIDCTDRALALFRATRHDIVNQSFAVLYPAQKDFTNTGRRIAPLIAKRVVFSDDRIMRRIDGSHFWVTVCGFGFNPKRPYELALWTFSDLSLKDKHSDLTSLLTARERDVAALVVHGMTSKEIGKELEISPRTVDIHRASLLRKYDVKTTQELIKRLLAYSGCHLSSRKRLTVRCHQIGHAVEAEVDSRLHTRVHRCTEALLCITSINPARSQTRLISRLVTVKEAFGRMEDFLLAHTAARKLVEHVLEVARRGLVRSDILRRDDRVEPDPQLAVAIGEAFVVHIRQDDQPVMLCEILQCVGRIRKRGPVANRPAVCHALFKRVSNAPLFREPLIHDSQQFLITLARRV